MNTSSITLSEFVYMINKAQAIIITLQTSEGLPENLKSQLEKVHFELKNSSALMLRAYKNGEVK